MIALQFIFCYEKLISNTHDQQNLECNGYAQILKILGELLYN
jgi:hypothetical protein